MINFSSHKITNLSTKIRHVNNKLIAGPQPKWRELKELKEQGVTLVIDLRSKYHFLQRAKEEIYCRLLGLKRVFLPNQLLKNLPDKKTFLKFNKLVKNNAGKTYVHCRSGKHRTNFFIVFYELTSEKKTIPEIMKYLRENEFYNVRHKEYKIDGKNKTKKEIFIERLIQFLKLFEKSTNNKK